MNIKKRKTSVELVGVLFNHRPFFTGPVDRWKVVSKLKFQDIRTEDLEIEFSFRDAQNFNLIWYANRCDKCHEPREKQLMCPKCGTTLVNTTDDSKIAKIKVELEISEINP